MGRPKLPESDKCHVLQCTIPKRLFVKLDTLAKGMGVKQSVALATIIDNSTSEKEDIILKSKKIILEQIRLKESMIAEQTEQLMSLEAEYNSLCSSSDDRFKSILTDGMRPFDYLVFAMHECKTEDELDEFVYRCTDKLTLTLERLMYVSFRDKSSNDAMERFEEIIANKRISLKKGEQER